MKNLHIAYVLIALISPTSAMADVMCKGPVYSVSVQPEADVYADFGYNHLKLCNMNSNVTINRGSAGGNVTMTPANCRELFNQFTVAKTNGQQVSAIVARSDCNFTDYVLPDPYPYIFHFYK